MGWACAQTRGGQEDRAVDNLLRQGYGAFCPTYSRPGRGVATVPSPLFPCYVFVRIERDQRWTSINGTFGVIRLLTIGPRSDPRPHFVPDDKVAAIAAMERTVLAPFEPGTLVRVRRHDSPFHDMVGTVASMDKRMRTWVAMSILGRDTEVRFVDPNELERA